HRIARAELLLLLGVGKGSRRQQAQREGRRGHEFAAAEKRTSECHGCPLEVRAPSASPDVLVANQDRRWPFRQFFVKGGNCFVAWRNCFVARTGHLCLGI